MPYQPNQGKTAVGVFADGLELKFVQLSMRGTQVTLRDFKSVPLVKKIDEKAPVVEAGEAGFGEGELTEGFGEPSAAVMEAGAEQQTNASVLLGLLSDLPSTKYTFNFAISEPAVSYHEFESDFGLKKDKLRKKIVGELSPLRTEPLKVDQVEYFHASGDRMMAVVREEGLQMYELLQEIRPFVGGRIPKVFLIDSSDTALLSLVRASYEFTEEEITVVIYVGTEFSRLIFMQGNEFLHFAPIISEGYNSPNIENTIYSRILLEQDNIALSRLDRILLAGEGHKVELRQSLSMQFSSSTVEYLTAPTLDVSGFEEALGNTVSEYAIPLAVAWRALDDKLKGAYDVNLIPLEILEAQKAFKLAWHGWLVAIASIASIVFFITRINERNQEIRIVQDELKRKKAQMQDLQNLTARRDALVGDIQRFSAAAVVYDSIAPASDRWSRIVNYLSNSVQDLNSLWLTRVVPDAQNPRWFVLTGKSLLRDRIPRLASLFERATIKSVKTVKIREKTLFEFEIIVEQIDKHDAAGSVPVFKAGP